MIKYFKREKDVTKFPFASFFDTAKRHLRKLLATLIAPRFTVMFVIILKFF